MPGHLEKKEIIYMLILVGFVTGVFYFYNSQHNMLGFVFRNVDGMPKNYVASGQSQAKRTFQKNVEASLNEMLSDVYTELQAYRERRKILHDIVRPRNLRNAKYINESYNLAQQTIVDLGARHDKIMTIFDQKEMEIKNMVKDRPEATKNNVMQAWERMKSKQVRLYQKYFAIEKEMLGYYDGLITLYHQNSDAVMYSAQTDKVIFNSFTLNEQAGILSGNIQALKQQQAALTQ